jgi:hypothetical protein
MKTILIFTMASLLFSSCSTNQINPENKDKTENTLSFEKNDEDEYDIIVLDPQYETFLKSIAKPKDFYSESYYKTKNEFYVMEWNLRYSQPLRYDPDFYAVRIDYNPSVDYGLNLEYKLFNFFQFINWKYKVNLAVGR